MIEIDGVNSYSPKEWIAYEEIDFISKIAKLHRKTLQKTGGVSFDISHWICYHFVVMTEDKRKTKKK